MKVQKMLIADCNQCTGKSIKKSNGACHYVPCCEKMNNKVLPYVKFNRRIGERFNSAMPTNVIPEWCPLEDAK